MRATKLFAAAIAVSVIAGPALASDLPTTKGPPAYLPPPPVWTWTGCYTGLHVGTTVSRTNITDVGNAAGVAFAAGGTAGQVFGYDSTTIIGGGQGGCNYQTGMFVVGIEGDLGYLGAGGSMLDPHTASNTTVGLGGGFYGDITGRVGVTFDQALFYAKGGGALFTGRESFFTRSAAYISNTNTNTFGGYAVGGGIEYHLGGNWSIKAEYLHFGFGSQTFNVVATGGTFPFRERLSADTGTIGLNYKFDWFAPPTPVVAKY